MQQPCFIKHVFLIKTHLRVLWMQLMNNLDSSQVTVKNCPRKGKLMSQTIMFHLNSQWLNIFSISLRQGSTWWNFCSMGCSLTAEWLDECHLYKWNALHQAVEWEMEELPSSLPTMPAICSKCFLLVQCASILNPRQPPTPYPQDVNPFNQPTSSWTAPQCPTVTQM